ncbi:hypothetical protein DIPPA_14409 [Diplonema papillatum]|nr:hypothetical protein DIPPA_14409 [Diplonema papillatum]|eukprot:gene18319-28226_t
MNEVEEQFPDAFTAADATVAQISPTGVEEGPPPEVPAEPCLTPDGAQVSPAAAADPLVNTKSVRFAGDAAADLQPLSKTEGVGEAPPTEVDEHEPGSQEPRHPAAKPAGSEAGSRDESDGSLGSSEPDEKPGNGEPAAPAAPLLPYLPIDAARAKATVQDIATEAGDLLEWLTRKQAYLDSILLSTPSCSDADHDTTPPGSPSSNRPSASPVSLQETRQRGTPHGRPPPVPLPPSSSGSPGSPGRPQAWLGECAEHARRWNSPEMFKPGLRYPAGYFFEPPVPAARAAPAAVGVTHDEKRAIALRLDAAMDCLETSLSTPAVPPPASSTDPLPTGYDNDYRYFAHSAPTRLDAGGGRYPPLSVARSFPALRGGGAGGRAGEGAPRRRLLSAPPTPRQSLVTFYQSAEAERKAVTPAGAVAPLNPADMLLLLPAARSLSPPAAGGARGSSSSALSQEAARIAADLAHLSDAFDHNLRPPPVVETPAADLSDSSVNSSLGSVSLLWEKAQFSPAKPWPPSKR